MSDTASSSDAGDAGNVSDSFRGRKRVRQPSKWMRNVSKEKRNTGKAYVSRSTKHDVEERVIGPPCRDGCFDKVTRPVIEAVFKKFWEIGSYDLQNSYLQKIVHQLPIKRRRKPKNPDAPGSSHASTLHCTVVFENVTYSVCKTGFLSIFGLKRRRLENAIKKISVSLTPLQDKRGKHRHLKIDSDEADCVVEHITSLETVSSHYTRAKSPKRRYMDSNLSLPRLYVMYKHWMAEHHPDVTIVKESFYRHIFTTRFNISFKPPKTDTCSTCDEVNAGIKGAVDAGNPEAENELKIILEDHKKLADEGQRMMREFGRNSDEETRVICIDLQQTQPIPKLSTSVAYYKRKMWMFNLCIHDIKKNKSVFYVWDEVTAGRGAVEIATCIRKWLDVEYGKGDFSKLVVFSDNCGGQNKNIFLVHYYLRELHSARLQDIVHYYLVPGHSYMACDRAFGHIEKEVRLHGDIYDLDTYVSIIEKSVHEGYEVFKVRQDEFLDITALKKYTVQRKARAPFQFSKARRFEFKLHFREGYFMAMGYGMQSPLGTVRLMPGRSKYRPSTFNLNQVPLQPKYDSPVMLKSHKVKDLVTLLNYVPPANSQYLQQVVETQQLFLAQEQKQKHRKQSAAREESESESEEEPDDILDYYSHSDDNPDDPDSE